MNFDGRPPVDAMTNPRADRVKDVAQLAGRPLRLKRQQFMAEGPQSVREALNAHRACIAAGGSPVVAEVYASLECLKRYPELMELAEDPVSHLHIRVASELVLEAMSDTQTPQGVVAVCNFVDVPLEQVLAARPKLVAIMCQVRDPGNAGTLLRAADAAGADAVVLTGASVDIYNPKAVRATAGSLFHLPVVRGVSAKDAVALCKAAGLGVLAADGYGHVNLDVLQDESAARSFSTDTPEAEYQLEDPTAWLFGNEAAGLSDEELSLADHRVAVPVYGSAESLNLGTAATVCLYASARAQRRG